MNVGYLVRFPIGWEAVSPRQSKSGVTGVGAGNQSEKERGSRQ